MGQYEYEEIDRGPMKGKNFGWSLIEGNHYYDAPGHSQGDLCTTGCKTRPILEYSHTSDGEDNSNITGGYVSRRVGSSLAGMYVFADYGSGRIWAIPSNSPTGNVLPAPLADTTMKISSFGEGVDGRLYLTDLYGGAVYRIDAS